jgi:hypothetical protein
MLGHFRLSRARWTAFAGSKLPIGFARLPCTAGFALLALCMGGMSSQGQDQRGTTLIQEDGTSAVANGNYYALVIGIDDYPPPLRRLKTAVADARAISSALREDYGFQVQLLLDRDATRAHILDAIARYRNTLSTNDNLLIYYAGHGYSDHEADKAYWLPADADSSFSANRIIADDLTTGVRVLPARHVLVISDSCYSGALTRDVDAPVRSGGQAAFINRMLRSRSRTLMASGGDEPVSDQGSNGHSVFAYALLRALERTDGQMFTASDMFYGSVREQVAGRSEQLPEYSIIRNSSHDEGDFVFSRKTATLEVQCDLACNWSLDGQAKGHINAGGSGKVTIGLGDHLVVAKTEDGADKAEWRSKIDSAGLKVVPIKLQPMRDSRLHAEQQREREQQVIAEQQQREKEQEAIQQQAARYSIRFRNDCNVTVYMALTYFSDHGNSVVQGWWKIDPSQEVTTPQSSSPIFYFYAKASGQDAIWDGTGEAESLNADIVYESFFRPLSDAVSAAHSNVSMRRVQAAGKDWTYPPLTCPIDQSAQASAAQTAQPQTAVPSQQAANAPMIPAQPTQIANNGNSGPVNYAGTTWKYCMSMLTRNRTLTMIASYGTLAAIDAISIDGCKKNKGVFLGTIILNQGGSVSWDGAALRAGSWAWHVEGNDLVVTAQRLNKQGKFDGNYHRIDLSQVTGGLKGSYGATKNVNKKGFTQSLVAFVPPS